LRPAVDSATPHFIPSVQEWDVGSPELHIFMEKFRNAAILTKLRGSCGYTRCPLLAKAGMQEWTISVPNDELA